jgi:hypothetical protein
MPSYSQLSANQGLAMREVSYRICLLASFGAAVEFREAA